MFEKATTRNNDFIDTQNFSRALCEKYGLRNVRIESGLKNIVHLKQFVNLFKIWPTCFSKDPHQNLLSLSVFICYPNYQYLIFADEKVIGYLATVPVRLEKELKELPRGGYTWGIQNGVKHVGRNKNTLCALAAVIDPTFKGSGMSTFMIELLKKISQAKGYPRLIVPVRPTKKHLFPHETMHDYLQRASVDKVPFDPWIRAHHLSGGKFRNVCEDSIVIKAKRKAWQRWQATSDGVASVFPGGLVTVKYESSSNIGTYREPNVWFEYSDF
ncbi:MAG: hypothetical protein H7A01_13880 [Hahellaceae bacterium]|nr:hypothetical protein [Hahellaceae bacterium]MCP5209589.1 hypothetical protein [Hahellaceae bacterium]